MGYYNNLEKAAEWLVTIQNQNKGWGMTHGQASSIVNTAEAVYVLTRVNPHHPSINSGLGFIQEKLFTSIKRLGSRTRYLNFALLGVSDHPDKVDASFLTSCSEWLIGAKNKDGGWGHTANDNESELFPTCMTLLMLSRLRCHPRDLESGFNWLISKMTESGWSFEEGKGSTPTATALGVLALRCIKNYNDSVFSKPKEFLLTTSHWGTERENLPGTLWEHCTYMWIFPALVSLDVNPYATTIAQGVREINKLTCTNGWMEPSGGVTVRGQFWAVFAFDAVHRAFDPAIHIYRIDSEKTQSALTEPEFINIKVHSKWAMIVPRQVYRLFAYTLFAFSIFVFSGLHRFTYTYLSSRRVDLLVSVFLFICVYFLVHKRKSLFPEKILWTIGLIVTILGFIDLVFGISVINLFEQVNKFFSK